MSGCEVRRKENCQVHRQNRNFSKITLDIPPKQVYIIKPPVLGWRGTPQNQVEAFAIRQNFAVYLDKCAVFLYTIPVGHEVGRET
jgi:hypothetical protein